MPLVVCDMQRGGPSTGLPTKTEQSDLLQAMFGRNGEAPVPIVAAQSPADCFAAALEAVRIALTLPHAGVPAVRRLPGQRLRALAAPERRRPAGPLGAVRDRAERRRTATFLPYLRDPDTLARPWAIPGTPGLEHRIGGIEKADRTGNISYDPDNHDFMVRTRQAKVDGIARTIAPLTVDDPDGDARVLVSAGDRPTDRSAPRRAGCAEPDTPIAQAHLRHLNPFPAEPRRQCWPATTRW